MLNFCLKKVSKIFGIKKSVQKQLHGNENEPLLLDSICIYVCSSLSLPYFVDLLGSNIGSLMTLLSRLSFVRP